MNNFFIKINIYKVLYTMSLTCPLCRSEWIIVSKLCSECDRIRYLMSLYSRDKVIEILDKTLVVQKFKEDEKKEVEDKSNTDESYIKPKTRSEKKV